MPYIKPELRTPLEFLNPMPSNAGELNYAISHLVHRYIIETKKGVSYANVNEALGVMLCSTLEFYRTVVAPYENVKALENGAVSALDQPFFDSLGKAPAAVEGSAHDLLIGALAEAVALAVQKPATPAKRRAKQPATEAAKTAPVAAATPSPATENPPSGTGQTSGQNAPLKRGETRVLTGPIPGDTPGGKPVVSAPVKRPQGPRLPAPGPNASAGERALHALAEESEF